MRLRRLFEAAKRLIPNLTHFGIGIFSEEKAPKEIDSEAVDAQIAEGQNKLGQRLEEIAIVAEWLKHTVQTKSINRHHSSYGYKHTIERWCRGRNGAGEIVPNYVANGSFLAAAVGLRLKFKQDGPNAYFNISERSLPLPMEGSLSFTDWLMKHRNRNSPLGDLARGMVSDRSWPVDASTAEMYRSHLRSMHASSEAVQTLSRAWRTYQSFLKRPTATRAVSRSIEHSDSLQPPTQ